MAFPGVLDGIQPSPFSAMRRSARSEYPPPTMIGSCAAGFGLTSALSTAIREPR